MLLGKIFIQSNTCISPSGLSFNIFKINCLKIYSIKGNLVKFESEPVAVIGDENRYMPLSLYVNLFF